MKTPKPQLVVERNFNDCTKCGAKEAQLTTVTKRGEETLLVVPHQCRECGKNNTKRLADMSEVEDD